ncbi:tyrosine-type recombinase/integrase [Singulisphaera acidiphila]|uniref:Site-specific recombinase XerD n=1 Tax=Singulisphaera acidiphila (strain ATCC BAA-1392 / DSM 18658 / VKM B-2454 / MOB10) TaxID=886293 RepID=L0DAA6_SINAD|nr:tyrosine-type recombinase/integrase [Singulisphaera acidiphila]AGA26309.1 site-specific recombinase XerD [Singulisphaera acidiphila DSM 18658]
MASLQQKGNGWYCQFIYHGKRHTFAVGRVSEAEAKAKSAQVDYLLLRLKQRLIELPPGVGIAEFVQNDGRSLAITSAVEGETKVLTLVAFRDRYLDTHRPSLEPRTVEGIELHFKHLVASLGERFPIRELKLANLQGYIDARAKAKGLSGRRLSPATIRKEIISLRTAWNWGAKMGLVAGRFPNDGLRFGKVDEKPPFMTREEIERRIVGATDYQKKELWDALFLTLPEVTELLGHVREAATLPWVYPMVCFAAHTGARRSELLRVAIADIDFEGKAILINEKKRTRGKRTTRRVPMSAFMANVLKEWLAVHPGGPFLFCNGIVVERSKKRSRTTGHKSQVARSSTVKGRLESVSDRESPGFSPITKDEAHDHLRRSLRGSRWEVIKGWHIARHSFASNCAAKGIDQRLIDRWLGHTTDEMRRRYQHLIPNQEQQAIGAVFG